MMRCPEWGERHAVIAADSDDLKHHGAENSPWKNSAPSSLTTFSTSESTSICSGLRNRKCIFEQPDIGFGAGLKINAHNVEAEWRIALDLAQKFARNAGEIALLLRVNGRFSRNNVTRRASLHLDKA